MRPYALAENGFIELDLWLFDELGKTHVDNLYNLELKWQVTLKQNRKELVVISHAETWLIMFENSEE